MGEKVNNLENKTKNNITLFHCGSKLALELEKALRDKGYKFNVKITGFPEPILQYSGGRLIDYPQINTYFQLD